MYLTIKVILDVTEEQAEVLLRYEKRFYSEIVRVCSVFENEGRVFEYPYKYINSEIAFHSKRNIIQFARKMFQQKIKDKIFWIRKSSVWNAKSFHIQDDYLDLEFGRGFYPHTLHIKLHMHDFQRKRLNQGEIIRMDIIRGERRWFASFIISVEDGEIPHTPLPVCNIMGIDLGLKVPAVAAVSNGKIKFFGNGRYIRYLHHHYFSLYRRLQKQNRYDQIRAMKHRLMRIRKNIDHQLSREIVNFALENNVSEIHLEDLNHIHESFDSKIPYIFIWSYRRLQEYIVYKARLAGIKICFIDPRMTSQHCPNCGHIGKIYKRNFVCKACDYQTHRDIVGAHNIMKSTRLVKSRSWC